MTLNRFKTPVDLDPKLFSDLYEALADEYPGGGGVSVSQHTIGFEAVSDDILTVDLHIRFSVTSKSTKTREALRGYTTDFLSELDDAE